MKFYTRFSARLLPAAIVLLLATTSCESFLDVGPPPTQVDAATVFTTDASATGAMLGVYSGLNSTGTSGITNNAGLSTFLGLAADELTYANAQYDQYRLNNVSPVNGTVDFFWGQTYTSIYQLNTIVDGLQNNTTVTPALRNQLLGEARFLRAFLYFHLANLFGDVPLVLTTDYRVAGQLGRTPKTEVYAQVLADLLEAQKLLVPAYPVANERTRVNQAAATALLARVYLYQQNWAAAEAQATAVINQTSVYQLVAPATTFLAGSQEAIWQLRRGGSISANTYEGQYFIPASLTVAPTATYLLTNQVYAAFVENDVRRSTWTNSYTLAGTTYRYPFKYKQRVATTGGAAATEHSQVLRLAEQYLIRAEARARQGKSADAVADLNAVRARASATPLAATLSSNDLLLAVENERLRELFAEWGHRWFDLIRTGRAAAVLPAVKGQPWDPNDAVWPIPNPQLLANPNLTQNAGY
ncbi:RagB/SusD family nutrient uptake outer membrane protein [Hymenobacter aerilatus]|uniref:RagB/SusD family nutrient uptake outer membrane protein n=1 Tax=Hymenobacter aerilatus TaxID=2932251 RepID=A0A8T9SSA9_9BACT|nr:RagB/SusD family nutrient uptake outer membrane protein [Hymenobacter aerilatus]UOR03904.1 RagB/SusD family nutrient uptake outer membrane protein [Hymenobacter aerilatus]